jgi:hypothetical protein
MTAGQDIDYEALAQEAMRGVVRSVLTRVAKGGLPGEHHFYIAFNTQAPGVNISKRLKEKYPEEMTIVLQHRFWDLIVSEERFEVKLTFDSIPERLVIPFQAVKVFFDPSVPYGLQFEESQLAAETSRRMGGDAMSDMPSGMPRNDARTGARPPGPDRLDKRREKAPRRPKPEKVAESTQDNKPEALPKASGAQTRAPAPKPQPVPASKVAESAKPDDSAPSANVVSLDQFRKK